MLLFILIKQLKEETRYDVQMYTSLGDEDEHQNLSSDDNQVIQQENVCSEPPEPLCFSFFPESLPRIIHIQHSEDL